MYYMKPEDRKVSYTTIPSKSLGRSELYTKILADLKARNEDANSYRGAVDLCVNLREKLYIAKKENINLYVAIAKLEQDKANFAPGEPTAECMSLMKSVTDLQAEILALQKRNSLHSEEMLSLRRSLDETELRMQQKISEADRVRKELISVQKANEDLRAKISAAQKETQLIKDEHAVLLLQYSTLEKSYAVLENDIKEIGERWARAKENFVAPDDESVLREKQAKVREAMERAMQEPRESR